MNNLFFKSLCSFLVVSLLLVVGCKKDDDTTPPVIDTVAASFQVTPSATNWMEVSFSNFSQNATSYAWDFGDSNTSTEESPTHTYAAGGTYTVTLTATGANGSATKSEDVTITDPNQAASFLAGTGSKTWYLDREAIALGIGDAPDNPGWWSFGGNTPLGERPCILDDSYTFHSDGTFELNSNNTIFIDSDANGGWLEVGVPEGCHDESEAGLFTARTGEDVSAWANGGSYTYDFDATANTITLNGLGAYIGLPQKTENGDNYIPESTKTYDIFATVEDAVADRLHMAIEITNDDGSNGGYWSFYLVSYHNPADLPEIPGSMPAASFDVFKSGNTVDFTNTSSNATSYSWDFGDGGMSMDENPTHTYAMDGDYVVTLTAMDDMGQSDEAMQTVSISSAVFSADKLSNAAGKVWKLDGEGSYYVGPGPNSSEWWGGVDANGVIERACQFDDEYIFTDGGNFEYKTNGDVWGEAYMGVDPPACVGDGDLVSPFNVFASNAGHGFSATADAITVTGTGAFIGFNKPTNQGEVSADVGGTIIQPASSITYQVLEYSNNGGVERVTITCDYSENQDNTANWTMRLISQ